MCMKGSVDESVENSGGVAKWRLAWEVSRKVWKIRMALGVRDDALWESVATNAKENGGGNRKGVICGIRRISSDGGVQSC